MGVLITGATGFLGEHLACHLLADGVPVRVLARSPAKARSLVARGAELVVGDITDEAALRRALQDVTVVYHLAGKLFIPGVPAAEYAQTHVAGTRILLAQCREQAQIEQFVHCSTTGVLGVTGDRPADERTPYRPTNAYERTKLEAELLVRAAWQQGFPATIVRPGLVYGPGDLHLLGFFRAIQRRLFRPVGRRPVWLHPIFIDDMTEALLRCGQHPRAIGECFHIAGREPVTIATLAATIAGALGVAPPRGWIPLPVAWGLAAASEVLPARLKQVAPLTRSRLDFLTHSRIYDVTKACQVLGFAAPTQLPDGIARTVAWYRAEGYLSAAGKVGGESPAPAGIGTQPYVRSGFEGPAER
jgi:dihydroflavonol-4-reductase